MKNLCLSLMILSCSLGVNGQEKDSDSSQVNKPLFSTTIKASAYTTPFTELLNPNNPGTYRYQQAALGAIIPLTGRFAPNGPKGHPRLWELFLTAGIAAGEQHIGFIDGQRILQNAALGVSGLYYFGKQKTLVGGLYGFIAEDDKTILHPEISLAGFFLFNGMICPESSYKFGLAYTYVARGIPFKVFGNYFSIRAVPIPLAGISWKPAKDLSVNVLLPLSASVTYNPGDKYYVKLYMSPNGGYNNYDNADKSIDFNNSGIPVVQVRRGELRYGLDLGMTIRHNFSINLGGGWANNRSVAFSYQFENTPVPLYESEIQSAPFIQFGFSCKLRKKNMGNVAVSNNGTNLDAINAPVLDNNGLKEIKYFDFTYLNLDNLDLNDLSIDDLDLEDINLEDIEWDKVNLDDVDPNEIREMQNRQHPH